MPLTDRGFQRLTYDDILNIQIDRAKLLFGDDIDTSEKSVFGKFLRLYCLDAAENQEYTEKVYLSAFPNTADGVSLDRLCPLVGISRNPATYAQHEIEVSGIAGETIEMGFLVSAGDIVFHTVNSYVIGEDGTAKVIVECNDAGTIGNVAIGDINSIVNPSAYVSAITHTDIIALGTEIETDYELRTRFSTAVSGIGSGTLEAIRGAILRVTGVRTVLIEENATNETVNGLPPHSFLCYVHAPTTAQQAIAEAIFDKKPLGISSIGDVVSTVTDISGTEHTVKFSWTKEVNIHVKCNIDISNGVADEIVKEIKDSIVSKISSYTNGQDVTATSLYSNVYVDGVSDVTSLEISSDGATYGTSAISIANNEVARTAETLIEVIVNDN